MINSPVLVGTALQFPGPCSWIYDTKMISSSGVHGPFFTPILSQQGGLPILTLFISSFQNQQVSKISLKQASQLAILVQR